MEPKTAKNMKKNLPVQAASVQRVLHTTAPGVAGQEGVEASGIWDILKKAGSGALRGALASL